MTILKTVALRIGSSIYGIKIGILFFHRVRDFLDRTLHNPTYDSAAPLTTPTPPSTTPTSRSDTLSHQYETVDSRRRAVSQNQRVSDYSDSGGNYSLAGPPTYDSDDPLPIDVEPQPYEIVGVASPTRYKVSQQNKLH